MICDWNEVFNPTPEQKNIMKTNIKNYYKVHMTSINVLHADIIFLMNLSETLFNLVPYVRLLVMLLLKLVMNMKATARRKYNERDA